MNTNIQTRKINFVQDFLRIESEESLRHLEVALHKERLDALEKAMTKTMTDDELYSLIDRAEQNSADGKLTRADEVLKQIDR